MSNIFKLCPTLFSIGRENFSRGSFAPLRPLWLRAWTQVACIFSWPQGTCLVCLMVNTALCVGRVKTVVPNHLRQMFRSHIQKAAERNTAAKINS